MSNRSNTSRRRSPGRAARLFVAAVAVLTLATLATPVLAGSSNIVNLDPGYVGVNSAAWKSAGGCSGFPPAVVGDVRWILRMNNLSPVNVSSLQVSVTFQNDGVKLASSTPTNGGATHTWLVDTTGNDIIQAASLSIGSATADAIVVVDICPGTASTPQQSLQDASMAGSRPQTATWLVGFGFILLISASGLAVANAYVGRRRG